jgi:Tol biopolymer transport system component
MYQIDELLRLVQADGRGDDRWPSSTDQLGRNRPDWSWDGTRVAFNRGTEIWVANADGSDEHRVVACSLPCTNAEDPSWSPDGTRIAYWSNGDSITTQVIRIASATDGRTLQTIKADAYLGPVQPRWAPDGRTLAVTLEHYVPTAGDPALDSSGIGVIDLTEPVPRITLVAPFSLMATYPAWSPSGDRILFTAGTLSPESTGSPGASNLYVVNRDGTKLVQLTHQKTGQARLFEPDWTANPKQIVLVLIQPDGAEQLATIAPDGTDLQPIVDPTSGQPITGKHPRQTRPPT